MKRRKARAIGRRGIMITNSVNRGEQILNDPEAYFSAARKRARATVESDQQKMRRVAKA